MNKPWTERLRERWQLNSIWQVVVVLLVFACTGFTVLFIKKPLLNFFVGEAGSTLSASILYYLLILPLYNIILLLYGFVFGQFKFFWAFEKRFLGRIAGLFKQKGKV